MNQPGTTDRRGGVAPSPPPSEADRGGGVGTPTMSTVETAHSTLFFVSDRVYKMPKRAPVGRADLRRREAREAACRAEIVRNRPFAPGVYLGVADVRDDTGTPVEHMVVMRRLPGDRSLSELLARGEPVRESLRDVARSLVAFHERCETTTEIASRGRLPDVEAGWLAATDALAPFRQGMLAAGEVDDIRRLGLRYLCGREALFDGRAARGRIRDGHGNLLAEHIFCLPDGPRMLDRVPADDSRRVGDVLADAAVLAVDLELRGAPELARSFLGWFGEFAGETHPPSLAQFYLAQCAVMRAGASAVRARLGDESAAGEARRLIGLAREHLRRARVRLVLVGGAPGSLRSALAGRLAADQDGWVLLSAAAVRRELAVDPAGVVAASVPLSTTRVPTRVPTAGGTRGSGPADAVCREMLRRAREALENGDSVILEAPWSDAGRRSEAATVAADTWADLIELRCSAEGSSLAETARNGRLAAGIPG
ncbi:AAA family ATPase [Parafrankia elaeagni]|uniref:AAA family ATPase n=1 Tax=Parafrankia elaeagni TaxID=222534 RepID=UPI00039A2644|nr:hypothetical protein [Parafrankia elaeagni]